tara:strand:- start:651 stop:950 length:300 start_codon:yes stop_codon:yes gene_type:complete
MVKVTNITDRVLSRRTPAGNVLRWAPRESKEIESQRLLEEVSRQECFAIGEEVGKKDVGAGLKTGVRKPKAKRKSSRAKPKKEVKPKKPKGLKKSKRAD